MPGGRAVLFERAISADDEGLSYADSRRSVGVCRLELATLQVDELNFRPDPGAGNAPEFAGAPDGEQVAVLQPWGIEPVGRGYWPSDGRVTLWIGAFDGSPARKILTLQGGMFRSSDDQPVQWSPDGRWLALSVSVSTDELTGRPGPSTVHLVDASTGAIVSRLNEWRLCGTASWTPNSRQLLVAQGHESGRDAISIFDLDTHELTTVVPVSGRPQNPTLAGARRPLGLADQQRVLVAVRRGTTMTLSVENLDDEKLRPLLRWDGELDMYPVVAQMPADYWT